MKFLKTIFNQLMAGVSSNEFTALTQDEILNNVKLVADALTEEDNVQLKILLNNPQIVESLKSFIPEQKHSHIRWMEQALLYASGCYTPTYDHKFFERPRIDDNAKVPNTLACSMLVEAGANPRGYVTINTDVRTAILLQQKLPNGDLYESLAHSLDKQKDDMAFSRVLSIVGLKLK
jgi:hypothetical protein